MRLDKFLAGSGAASRRQLKQIAKQNKIKVNGKTVCDVSVHINENTDIVEFDGKKIEYMRYAYLMLNKPQGCVSAVYDKKLPTVADYVPDGYKHFGVFPVGRLDIDTEGLLLMTNDGDLCHKLLSPKYHVSKKYFVISESEVTEQNIIQFNEGVIIDGGYKTMPAKLEITGKCESFVTICEGKFHQVKQMYEATGNKVKYLKRVSMGNLKLDGNLKPGQMRPLTESEINLIRESTNGHN